MKRITNIITAAIAASLLASCTSTLEDSASILLGEGNCHITIGTGDMRTKTDSDHDGRDDLNENAIKRVDYFIYPASAAETDACLLSGHLDVNTTRTVEFTIDLKEALYNQIFPSGATKAKIYAVVNLPEGQSFDPEASLKTVKETVITADFKSTAVQDCFLMSGEADLAATSDGATGTVEVRRVASKVTISMTVEDSYPQDDDTFYLHPEYAKVLYFKNCFHGGVVDGAVVDAAEALKFDYTSRNATATTIGDDAKTVYAPAQYYTYPAEWEFGSEYEPYFLITIPYTKNQPVIYPGSWNYCTYKVILPNNSFARNCWYNYSINLKVLGSLTPIEPVIVVPDDEFYVYDWGAGADVKDGNTTNGEVKAIHYLTVEKNEYTAYNVARLEIPFTTSHEAEIVDAKMTYDYYNTSTSAFTTTTADASDYISLSNGNIAVLEHALVNDISSSDLDVVPYTFTFRIQHKDDASTTDVDESAIYFQDITIVQTPAIIVTKEQNTATGTAGTGEGTRGDVYVNGQYRYLNYDNPGTGTDYEYVGAARYYSVRTRTGDQFMYSIQTLVLPTGTDYIITDPRMPEGKENKIQIPFTEQTGTNSYGLGEAGAIIDLFQGTDVSSYTNPGIGEGPALYGDSPRKMMYYYATQTTEASEDFIAPKFRIASNFCSAGSIGSNTKYFDMARRCAAYQEAGYPAGRWRLPTKAEIEYVVALQNLKKIPQIFTPSSTAQYSSGGYYSATRGLYGSTFLPSDEIYVVRSVRCVYDDWFWENTENGGKVDKATFTWGDMPRKATN